MQKTGSLYRFLEDGEVDLLVGSNAGKSSDFYVVAEFESQAHYIVAQPGNRKILEELNMALDKIYESDPNFAAKVYEKNFQGLDTGLSLIHIYKLEAADNIVLASPMYFHSITGKMKALIDRFQVYWAGHVRNDMPEKPVRKGAILMVGGAPSFPNQFLGGELVLKNLLNDLSAEFLGEVCLPNSDHDSLETRPDIAQEVKELAEKMKAANKAE